MTRAGAPLAAVAATQASTSRMRVPPARAVSTADWMMGPSMSGSL